MNTKTKTTGDCSQVGSNREFYLKFLIDNNAATEAERTEYMMIIRPRVFRKWTERGILPGTPRTASGELERNVLLNVNGIGDYCVSTLPKGRGEELQGIIDQLTTLSPEELLIMSEVIFSLSRKSGLIRERL
jgi:hypothetical protein